MTLKLRGIAQQQLRENFGRSIKFEHEQKQYKYSIKLLKETMYLYSNKLNEFISKSTSKESVLKFKNFKTRYEDLSYAKVISGVRMQ